MHIRYSVFMAKKRKIERTCEDNYMTLSKAYGRLISDFNILEEAYRHQLDLFEQLSAFKMEVLLTDLSKKKK